MVQIWRTSRCQRLLVSGVAGNRGSDAHIIGRHRVAIQVQRLPLGRVRTFLQLFFVDDFVCDRLVRHALREVNHGGPHLLLDLLLVRQLLACYARGRQRRIFAFLLYGRAAARDILFGAIVDV